MRWDINSIVNLRRLFKTIISDNFNDRILIFPSLKRAEIAFTHLVFLLKVHFHFSIVFPFVSKHIENNIRTLKKI